MPISAVFGTATQPSASARVLSSDDPDAAIELARTLEALQLLGRDPNGGSVTAEEIRVLEQQGRLK
jgi:hypothetical protein